MTFQILGGICRNHSRVVIWVFSVFVFTELVLSAGLYYYLSNSSDALDSGDAFALLCQYSRKPGIFLMSFLPSLSFFYGSTAAMIVLNAVFNLAIILFLFVISSSLEKALRKSVIDKGRNKGTD